MCLYFLIIIVINLVCLYLEEITMHLLSCTVAQQGTFVNPH